MDSPRSSGAPSSQSSTPARDTPAKSGPSGREGVKRGQYTRLDKEDETNLFRLCYKHREIYTSSGRGQGIVAFYERVVDEFEIVHARRINPQTARRHVERETNKWIWKLEQQATGEEEEDTQWATALHEWAIVEMEVRKKAAEKTETEERMSREIQENQVARDMLRKRKRDKRYDLTAENEEDTGLDTLVDPELLDDPFVPSSASSSPDIDDAIDLRAIKRPKQPSRSASGSSRNQRDGNEFVVAFNSYSEKQLAFQKEQLKLQNSREKRRDDLMEQELSLREREIDVRQKEFSELKSDISNVKDMMSEILDAVRSRR